MRNLRIPAALALAALALLAVGCGGDDEPSISDIVGDAQNTTTNGESATLSKQQVIAIGDEICTEGHAAIASLSVDADPAIAADQVGSITEGMQRELRDLDAPEQQSGALNDLIRALGDQVSALERRASTSRAADTAGYEAAGVELANARSAALTAGEEYGFEVCGQAFDAALPGGGTESGGVAPDAPVTPAPTTPAPAPGAGGGTAPPEDGGSAGGGSSGSSGGISPE